MQPGDVDIVAGDHRELARKPDALVAERLEDADRELVVPDDQRRRAIVKGQQLVRQPGAVLPTRFDRANQAALDRKPEAAGMPAKRDDAGAAAQLRLAPGDQRHTSVPEPGQPLEGFADAGLVVGAHGVRRGAGDVAIEEDRREVLEPIGERERPFVGDCDDQAVDPPLTESGEKAGLVLDVVSRVREDEGVAVRVQSGVDTLRDGREERIRDVRDHEAHCPARARPHAAGSDVWPVVERLHRIDDTAPRFVADERVVVQDAGHGRHRDAGALRDLSDRRWHHDVTLRGVNSRLVTFSERESRAVGLGQSSHRPSPAAARPRRRRVRGLIPLVSHPDFARLHPTGDHPETGERIRALHEAFPEFVEARPATVDDVAACHEREYVEVIRTVSESGRTVRLDPDTICTPSSYGVALLAAGAAMAAAELGGFALARPPGHHALPDRAMGFCLFGSIAIAARFAQRELGIRRVAVLDWDVHHGNGTQAMFWDDPSVLFVSLHRWPFYPGTGGPDEQNETTLNVPLPAGAGDIEYVEAMERLVEPAVARFEPDLLLVSAGYDAGVGDPLGGMLVTADGFRELARRAGGLCQRIACVLEGGYTVETLPSFVRATLDGLAP